MFPTDDCLPVTTTKTRRTLEQMVIHWTRQGKWKSVSMHWYMKTIP